MSLIQCIYRGTDTSYIQSALSQRDVSTVAHSARTHTHTHTHTHTRACTHAQTDRQTDTACAFLTATAGYEGRKERMSRRVLVVCSIFNSEIPTSQSKTSTGTIPEVGFLAELNALPQPQSQNPRWLLRVTTAVKAVGYSDHEQSYTATSRIHSTVQRPSVDILLLCLYVQDTV